MDSTSVNMNFISLLMNVEEAFILKEDWSIHSVYISKTKNILHKVWLELFIIFFERRYILKSQILILPTYWTHFTSNFFLKYS